jgi:hypothetical protein
MTLPDPVAPGQLVRQQVHRPDLVRRCRRRIPLPVAPNPLAPGQRDVDRQIFLWMKPIDALMLRRPEEAGQHRLGSIGSGLGPCLGAGKGLGHRRGLQSDPTVGS